MTNFGLICPPAASHVTGLTTIGRVLRERGHRVTVFNIIDVEQLAGSEGLEFVPLGLADHPRGSFQKFSQRLAGLSGFAAMKCGLQIAGAEIETLLREGPAALRAAGITALLVDQGQPAGSTLADLLRIPFFTICNAPPANFDPCIPPTVTGWGYGCNAALQLRNRVAYRALDTALLPLKRKINAFRERHNLHRLRSLEESFSRSAILAQETADFDFPRRSLPKHFHYVGLFRRTASAGVAFPFERLNGKPLIYATFGTILTAAPELFRVVSEVAADLDAQVVISLGGRGDVADFRDLPGNPIVVHYAPQAAILQRSTLTFCHAGNNTVLESLACGVPVLAVPIWGDQPGVAARLVRSGAGEAMELKHIKRARLREVCERLLREESYRKNAKRIGRSIEEAGGELRAADVIEAALRVSNR